MAAIRIIIDVDLEHCVFKYLYSIDCFDESFQILCSDID